MNIKNILFLFSLLYLLSACSGDTENDPPIKKDIPTTKHTLSEGISTKVSKLEVLKIQLYQTKDEASCRNTYNQMIALKTEILDMQKKDKGNTKVSIHISESPCTSSGFLPSKWKFSVDFERQSKTVDSI